MKKIILIGRTGCGKTTLTQALKGEKIQYQKTQYINRYDVIIDTPGEYVETKNLGGAIALYAYEADVVGLLISATDQYSLFSPNITCMANREVIGIVTQIDRPEANVERATRWLALSGCKTIYPISATSGEGIYKIYEHLKEHNEELPWNKEEKH